MRLIDADALEETFRKTYKVDGKGVICAVIDEAPTVEAEPVRHGRWEDCTNHESVDFEDKCSVCGYTIFADFSHRLRYCPNCGAKMEEEK